MEFIRNWITGICSASILLSVFCAIAPKTSATKMVRLCGSIILIFAVFAPIYNLETEVITEQIEATVLTENDLSITEIHSTNETLKASIIERQLTAYILQRTRQMGIDCEVSVSVKKNDQGQSIPERILVDCKQSDQQVLFNMIKDECGIKPEFLTTGSERVKE